ncbi:MAG: glutamine amidotransferase [Planctomycetaceae bacterium]
MTNSILYLGDTHLTDAAAYLAGLMHSWGWRFDYVPSHQPAPTAMFDEPRALFIVSDYPAARMDAVAQRKLVEQVANGAGLIMIGGWESFHGLGGDWDGTPVGNALPVVLASDDDRLNCDQTVLVRRIAEHPAVADLPWVSRPPVIGGFNRITPKPAATVLLEAQRFAARCDGESFTFVPLDRHPLLVVGELGRGRTAALATDVAPHWVGPLVDWGLPRVAAQAPQANGVEVGADYAKLLRQLLSWVGQFGE